jgi:UDP-N-acetylglucosamine--N-acetylmuramyl-(pentapeptide) pyrophosphoryl-undecaprenol N-acetylglucosamine transferase
MKTLLVMAGGTGGHVYPALAVAEFLRERGVNIVWLGTRAGLEARVVPEAGFDIRWMNISGLRGKGLLRHLMMPFLLLRAMAQGIGIVRRVRPDALLGMGGFAAGPGALSGWMLRRPLIIHEANASAGLTNRLLAPFAHRVLCGFPHTDGLPARAQWTGNPIRGQIRARITGRDEAPALRVLVVGGSLGARVFNQNLPGYFQPLIEGGVIEVRHQCGRGNAESVRAAYREQHVEAMVDEFIDDMGAAYGWADIVICRAGAMTVAELCVAGVAAILVPFPYAAGDHQTANARYLAEQDAAVLVSQQEFDGERVRDLLHHFNNDRASLAAMGARATSLARADATEKVGSVCLEVMHA